VIESGDKAVQALEEKEQSKVQEALEQQPEGDQDSRVSRVLREARSMSARAYVREFRQGLTGEKEYQIGPDDVISVRVYEEPDLSREGATVSQDGRINFPLIGRTRVAGMTPTQAEQRIAEKLMREQYLTDPHITVQVKEFRSKEVLVLGAVENPGGYYLRASESLLDILSRAGGVDFAKGGQRLTLIRTHQDPDNGENKIAIQVNLNKLMGGQQQYADLLLRNKDVIYIPKAKRFTVMGEVQKPGSYIIDNSGLSIVEAVGKAGGFTRIAAPNRTKIIRSNGEGKKVIRVNMNVLTKRSDNPEMVQIQPHDIIIVPESYL
jgi:polysaccharide export outer membrane protein